MLRPQPGMSARPNTRNEQHKMGAHEDWERAKESRDRAAYMLAKAYLSCLHKKSEEEAKNFLVADAKIRKLERELDGRDPE